METQTDYVIDSTHGPLNIHLTDGDYVVVRFEDLNLYRVSHSGHLRLKLYGAEGWKPERESHGSDYHALYLSDRWDGTKHISASLAAREKIKAVLIPEVVKWLAAHPEALKAAGRAKLAAKVAEAQAKVVEARTQFRIACDELRAARNVYAESE